MSDACRAGDYDLVMLGTNFADIEVRARHPFDLAPRATRSRSGSDVRRLDLRQRLTSLAVVAVLCGCGGEVSLTRAVVEVRSDLREELAYVRVEIGDATGERRSEARIFPVRDQQDPDFLLSFAVAPASGKEADRFLVYVSGLNEQQVPVVDTRKLASFSPHEYTTVRVRLDRACKGVICDLAATCDPALAAGGAEEPCVALDARDSSGFDAGLTGMVGAQGGGDRDAKSPGDAALVGSNELDSTAVATGSESSVASDAGLPQPPTDVNECELDNGGCPGEATCNNTVTGRTCMCNSGTVDVHGDGSECVGKCSLAGCDANAGCKVLGTEAVCECNSSHVGDGKTCTFDDSCSLLACDPNATCQVAGAARSCKCRDGFTGPGTTCANVDECTAQPGICGADSVCTDSQGAYSCACLAGYRDTGSGCVNIDDCTPNPCQNGGACVDGINTHTCSCLDGYTGEACELEICGDVVIRSRADVDANRLCAEIRGKLDIPATGLAEITSADFPYLTKVIGNVQIQGVQAGGGTSLKSVTLAKLKEIGGLLAIVSLQGGGPLQELHLPALTTVGSIQLTETGIKVLDLPVLATINEDAALYFASSLCTVNLRRVTRVAGRVSLTNAPNVSAQQFAVLGSAAAGTVSQTNIGCCLQLSTDKAGCENFNETARNLYCTGC